MSLLDWRRIGDKMQLKNTFATSISTIYLLTPSIPEFSLAVNWCSKRRAPKKHITRPGHLMTATTPRTQSSLGFWPTFVWTIFAIFVANIAATLGASVWHHVAPDQSSVYDA